MEIGNLWQVLNAEKLKEIADCPQLKVNLKTEYYNRVIQWLEQACFVFEFYPDAD